MATAEESANQLREVAALYAGGHGTVRDLWGALHTDLDGLCRDGPLQGPQVDLFFALEQWEHALGEERLALESELRSIAASVAKFEPNRLNGPGVP